MKASSFFTTVLAFAAAAVARAQTTPEDSEPKRLEEVPDGYTLAPMTWKGNITAEGPEVAFTGANFKDIDDQIHQANPDFTWPEVTANDTTPDSAVKSKSWLTCDPNNIWWAQEFRIEEGVAYLRGKSGQCYMAAGPRVCTRISCSYKSAIWWCNDQPNGIWIDCALWANYAQDILDKCQTHDASNRIRGQEFAKEDWNIMIGYSNDHC
ncbi:hypothetical protein GGS26DRAFT_98382 [Hypomontagnella submonticulosa]|nr:hypothetical protein GGS26DRAFT_98382 [Hypomontagnella submonticulosa]